MRLHLHLASTLLAVGPLAAQADYQLVDLGALAFGTSRAYAVNESGDVAGYTLVASGESHAFRWSGGTMTDLGTLPPSSWSIAYDLDEAGSVVGEAGNFSAFQWQVGPGMSGLAGTGWASRAYGINDRGTIVGEGEDAFGTSRAFVWRAGAVSFLGAAGHTAGAQAVNRLDDVVGWQAAQGGFQRATLWNAAGVATDLNSPGTMSVAYGLNEAGQVVGAGNFPGSGVLRQAFLWQNGVMTSLGALPGTAYPMSEAFAINSLGEVVGWADNPNGPVPADHAFLWEAGVMHDLNDRIPQGTGWELVRAQDINNAGEICGYGVVQGQTRGFLLRPDPPRLHLMGPIPGRAGTSSMLTARNATPGASVWFAYGTLAGSSTVPVCPGVTVAIQTARAFAPVPVGPTGVATMSATTPAGLAGWTLYLQAVEPAGCRVSNLRVHVFW